MTGIATTVSLILAFATSIFGGVQALRDRAINRGGIALAAITELAVLWYLGVRAADLIGGHDAGGLAVIIAYLVGIAVALPIAAVLAWFEPTRWGSVTLAVGALVVASLFARVHQLWTPHG